NTIFQRPYRGIILRICQERTVQDNRDENKYVFKSFYHLYNFICKSAIKDKRPSEKSVKVSINMSRCPSKNRRMRISRAFMAYEPGFLGLAFAQMTALLLPVLVIEERIKAFAQMTSSLKA